MKNMFTLPHSKFKAYEIKTSETRKVDILVTSIRFTNDINGNSRYKTQVWIVNDDLSTGSLWTPKVIGYKRLKDDSYMLKCVHNIDESMDSFVRTFEGSLNEL
jgi:hypothetical protein